MSPSPLVNAGSDRCKSTACPDVRVARTKDSSPSAVTSSIEALALPSVVRTLSRLSEGISSGAHGFREEGRARSFQHEADGPRLEGAVDVLVEVESRVLGRFDRSRGCRPRRAEAAAGGGQGSLPCWSRPPVRS